MRFFMKHILLDIVVVDRSIIDQTEEETLFQLDVTILKLLKIRSLNRNLNCCAHVDIQPELTSLNNHLSI